MKKLYNAAFIYLIIGLLSGVFAREYTKAQGIKGSTMLQLVHTHVLVLGFVFFWSLWLYLKYLMSVKQKVFVHGLLCIT